VTSASPLFTLLPAGGVGFTDQLYQFVTFYKLGRSLGYRYVHTPFSAPRSSDGVFTFLGFNARFAGRELRECLRWSSPFLERRHTQLLPPRWKAKRNETWPRPLLRLRDRAVCAALLRRRLLVDVAISDQRLARRDVNSFAGLQALVREVAAASGAAPDRQLIRFASRRGRTWFDLVHTAIPDLPDGLDLRAAYFEARRQMPWSSQFEPGKVRILVHIRLGDTAAVETPWGERLTHKGAQLSEAAALTQLDVGHYHRFVRDLRSSITGNSASILVCSDGYRRTFARLSEELSKARASATKLRQLPELEIDCERSFDLFGDIPDAALLVGETEDNLLNLIHSALLADVIVVGSHQRMLPKLLSILRPVERYPTILLLHRNGPPPQWIHEPFFCPVPGAITPVDIDHCDLPGLAASLENKLARRTAPGDAAR